MLNALLPALFLGASSIAGGPASAELTFTHAELTTPAGAESVYRRVVRTARHVCADENRHSPMSATASRICVTDTVERTLAEIAAPQLSEIHAARSVSPDGRAPRHYRHSGVRRQSHPARPARARKSPPANFGLPREALVTGAAPFNYHSAAFAHSSN